MRLYSSIQVLSAGYGGNLRAFLMNPSYEEGIDSFAGILTSGLPWEIGLYGEEVEGEMAASTHPVMKAIWDGKIPVNNEPFAYQRVSRATVMILNNFWNIVFDKKGKKIMKPCEWHMLQPTTIACNYLVATTMCI